MSFVSFLRSIYNVDTLDTRFTTPSTVPYKPESSPSSDGRINDPLSGAESRRDAAAENIKRAEPSKWRSPEFILYYLILLFIIPNMFWVAYDVSRRMYMELGYGCS